MFFYKCRFDFDDKRVEAILTGHIEKYFNTGREGQKF